MAHLCDGQSVSGAKPICKRKTETLSLCTTYSCRTHRHVFTAVGFHGMSLPSRDVWPPTARATLRFVRQYWWNFCEDFEGAYLNNTVVFIKLGEIVGTAKFEGFHFLGMTGVSRSNITAPKIQKKEKKTHPKIKQ